jgi:peptide/nickel transport system permease protein
MKQNNNMKIWPEWSRTPPARAHTTGQLVARRFLRNRLAVCGVVILLAMFAFSFLGGLISPYRQSQVFLHEETVWIEFAVASLRAEDRFIVAEGERFPEAARAQALRAIEEGAASFSSADAIYSVTREGEALYTIAAATLLARARMLAGAFMLEPAAEIGFSASEEFLLAAERALTAGEERFSADGADYLLRSEGKAAAIYRAETIALASRRVFDAASREEDALVSSFVFRYAAERALEADENAFTLAGILYSFSTGESGRWIISQEDGKQRRICAVSEEMVAPLEQDVFLSAGFKEAARAAIRAKEAEFVYADDTGEAVRYTLERVNNAYTIRALKQTRLISMYAAPSKEHLLGTDGNGMDVLTRLMYGGRVSLTVGLIVVLIESLIGIAVGGVSGYFGGWVDALLMRFVDLVNGIPFYPLVIIIGTVLDQTRVDPMKRIFYLMAVMGLLGWTQIARVVRGQILSLREQEFMLAAEATGLRASRKIVRHLLPNVMPMVIVQATLSLGGIIITEATLSFLGLGVKYPLASWGSMINAASDIHIMTNSWFIWIPAGLMIMLSVLGFYFVGDGLRDALDPRMKGRSI